MLMIFFATRNVDLIRKVPEMSQAIVMSLALICCNPQPFLDGHVFVTHFSVLESALKIR